YMWQAYAADYSGYCLEFATPCGPEADDYYLKERRPCFRFCTCEPVEYHPKLTPVPWNLQDNPLEYGLLFLRKAQRHEAEAEWRRLDWLGHGGQVGAGYHWYAARQLTAVIVGEAMGQVRRDDLCGLIARRGHAVGLREARRPRDHFHSTTLVEI